MDRTGESVYDFSPLLLDGREVSLAEFKGRALLIVNTASKCGFTPQYEGLEQLYLSYKGRGLDVLAFPCNQFGKQEPGGAPEIGAFCQQNYSVTFPMFARIDVNGPNAHPLYRFLKSRRAGFLGIQRISWNFTKFLIDSNGQPVGRFAPSRTPSSLIEPIESLLNQGHPSKR